MKYLYLDCSDGIHEAAVISALLEMGVSQAAVAEAVRSLPVPGIRFTQKEDGSFDRIQMDWQRNENRYSACDLKNWISEVNLSLKSKAIAGKILERYSAGKKQVVDVSGDLCNMVRMVVYAVALAACLEDLDIWDVIIPWLGEGSGFLLDETGSHPVPGAEVMKILEGTQISLRTMPVNQELITPEGAAMAAGIQTSDRLPVQYRIIRCGVCSFHEHKNGAVRASLLEDESIEQGVVYRLETNMDDVTGEALGYVMDRLLQAGAGDVHYHSVYMKKNRPAYQLNVICTESLIPVMEQIIFRETTTLGIRRTPMLSSRLKRTAVRLSTSLGPVQAKLCHIPKEDGTIEQRIYPEYTSVTELCKKSGKSFQEVHQRITAELHGTNLTEKKEV